MTGLARRVAAVLGAVALAGGCASGSDLAASTATVLQTDVAALASAAQAGEPGAVHAAADRLRRDVAAGRAGGRLSARRAQRILAASARVVHDAAGTEPPPPASRPAPAQPSGGDQGGGDGGGGD